jgi:nucleotide-binding universal stress UspA family protein
LIQVKLTGSGAGRMVASQAFRKGPKMYRHILIPTDGSAVAGKAARAGIKLAKSVGARVTGFYSIEPIWPRAYGEGYMIGRMTLAELDRRAREQGEQYLARMRKLAKAARVRFDSVCIASDTPHKGIIDTARKKHCDAIVMGSHGRGGPGGVILGSVTNKVLAQSKIPVLVYR